jgi:DNA-binding LacI/PurR family transcriptional regulator
MQKREPASKRALLFLNRLVDRMRKNKELRLATIPDLAGQAGVSPVTMMKAVQKLRNQGVLQSKKKYGTRINEMPGHVESIPAEEDVGQEKGRLKWQRLCAQIEWDILHGKYRPSVDLPSWKELGNTYNVSFRPLMKAFRRLVSQRLIVAHKTHYRIYNIADVHRNTILLIGRISLKQSDITVFSRNQELLRLIEQECMYHNLQLQTYRHTGESSEIGSLQAFLKNQAVASDYLGFILWTAGMTDEECVAIINLLQKFGRPISVLDVVGSLERHIGTRRNVRLFRMATSPQVGYDVGTYLYRRGHRYCAYFSLFHDVIWSQERFRGINEAFKVSGIPDAVRKCCLNWIPFGENFHLQDIVCTATGILAAEMDKEGTRHIAKSMTHMLSKITAFQNNSYRDALTGMMESVLSDKRITVWVAANDLIAFELLAFLEKGNMRIPKDISIIGFDDLFESFVRGLTSYNFNIAGIVRALLGHILNPWIGRTNLSPTNSVTVNGAVIERGSISIVNP